MRSILAGAAAAAAIALGATSAQAGVMLNANWNSNCGKSTCFDDKGVFSQTFSASAFGTPVTVGQLVLDRGILGSLDGSTFRLSFRLNGEELGAWGNYNMGGIGGDQLSFSGENFLWNPEDGDLELVLELVPPPKLGAGGGGGFLAAPASFDDPEGGQGNLQEDTPPENKPPGEDEPAQPRNDAVAPVPEPGAWALMIAGFGLAGASFRRRRAVLSAQPLR